MLLHFQSLFYTFKHCSYSALNINRTITFKLFIHLLFFTNLFKRFLIENLYQALFKILRIQDEQSPKADGGYVYVTMSCFVCPYIQVYIIPFLCPHRIPFFFSVFLFIFAYGLSSTRSDSYCWIHTMFPIFCYFQQRISAHVYYLLIESARSIIRENCIFNSNTATLT